MNRKTIIQLILLFVSINTLSYFIIETNAEHKVKMVFNEKIKTLDTHYKLLLQTQKENASTMSQDILGIDEITKIMQEAQASTNLEKVALREELHRLVDKKYQLMKQKGVLQFQFVFPNNESFYRAHKPSKFGDNLTDVRADFKYVNETKTPIRGFVQGKVAHGFRNTFPLFDSKKNHIGAMEISFSSDRFQWYLNRVSNIHSHLLIKKDIFDSEIWKRDDLALKYHQSVEDKNYMLSLGDTHSKLKCIKENKKRLKPAKEVIDSHMLQGKTFAVYVDSMIYDGHIDVVSFFPVQGIDRKTVAWIVSYEESEIIESLLLNKLILKILSLLLSLLMIYFIIKQINAKKDLQEQHKLLNDIINLTDEIMFITNFKEVRFANTKFKDVFNTSRIKTLKESDTHNVLDIFQEVDGYLHKGLLENDELFISLLLRTAPEKRMVTLLDENFQARVFKIDVTKTEDKQNCLVTLADITKIREQQIIVERKAYIDGLTNVYNRNKFDEIFGSEIQCSKRYKSPLSIALLDIDKFKDFNDTYGHLIGDEVLVTLAQTVNSHVRETDTFARWGGEEFVVLFKNTSSDDAKNISGKLKNYIEENTHSIAGKITASFGVTEYQEGDTLKSMFERCDKALYLAKENGRNRVEVL